MKEILLSKKSAHRGFHCTIFAAAASTSIRVFRKQFFGVKCGVNFTLDSIIVSGDSFPNDSNNSRPSRLFSIAPKIGMRAIDYQKFNEGSIEMCFFFSSPRDRVPKKTQKNAREQPVDPFAAPQHTEQYLNIWCDFFFPLLYLTANPSHTQTSIDGIRGFAEFNSIYLASGTFVVGANAACCNNKKFLFRL